MMSETRELRTVAERLARLERENRRLKAGGAAFVVLVSAALLMGQAAPAPDTIDARAFRVIDADGKVRAELAATEESPGLILFDADGKPRAGLRATEKGPSLELYDARGQTRAALALERDPSLTLYDPDGRRAFWAPR